MVNNWLDGFEPHLHSGASGQGAGTLTVANGTVSNPSLSFLNSTGAGFYRTAANSIGVATAGTLRLTLDTTTTGDAWTSWTPSWTNLTIGNATVSAKYWKVGKLVVAKIDMAWGTTTSASSTILVSLPVTAKAVGAGTSNYAPAGTAWFWDASAGVGWHFLPTFDSTTNLRFRQQNGTTGTGANVTSATPVTWTGSGTPDEFHIVVAYEAA